MNYEPRYPAEGEDQRTDLEGPTVSESKAPVTMERCVADGTSRMVRFYLH